jgi:hypothetical protein
MPMKVSRAIHILALLLVLVTAFALIYSPELNTGTIQGKVIIGPWTPVEPLGGSHPPPEVYTSRRIILEGTLLPRVEIPMNGTGYFRAKVRAGTYSVTISNCTFMGCSRALPETIVVKQGETTIIQLDIDTGIR